MERQCILWTIPDKASGSAGYMIKHSSFKKSERTAFVMLSGEWNDYGRLLEY